MNFQQFSYAFFLGIVFGCLLEATDSIFATITAHMIFNGSSILLTYAISKVSLFGVNNLDTANTVTVSSIIASIPVALIGLVLSIFLLVAIAYLNGRLGYIKTWFQKDIRQTWPKKHVTNISFWAAFIVCFLFSIMMEITSSFFKPKELQNMLFLSYSEVLLFFVILVYQIIIQITIPHSCISPIYNSSACILPHIIRKWDCWCGCFRIMCHPDLIFSDLTIFKIISKC